MSGKYNKPSLRNDSRPETSLNLSQAVAEVEQTGQSVTQSIQPKLRLRDALYDVD